jgi:starch phosphorylase
MARLSRKSALAAMRELIVEDPLGTFFGVPHEVFKKVWDQLTDKQGNSVTYVSMEIGADWTVHNPIKRRIQQLGIDEAKPDDVLDKFVQLFLHGPGKIPNYSGGLGILAGDTLKSFADCKIPVAAISLLYRKGYFSQLVDSELGQVSWATDWSPEKTPGLYLLHSPDDPQRPLEIVVPFYDKGDQRIDVRARVWMKMEVSDTLDFFVPVILLDYHTPSSPEWVKQAAQQLYDSSTEHIKIVQRRLLGAGVAPAMRALGFTSKTIHLNE